MSSERGVPSVPPPPLEPIATTRLFPMSFADSDSNQMPLPDAEALRSHLEMGGLLTKTDALALIEHATSLFAKEPNVLRLDDPITVCGDIHGQYYDLLTLLRIGGDPGSTQYLFLGDYVDRGLFSCEVTLLLFAYKMCYPQTFWMLRGNHECRQLSAHFNFFNECLHKYNEEVYNAFQVAFDHLPLGAVVSGLFLCVHGGISPHIKTIDDISNIDRVQEPPTSGPMCDLLWADPMEDEEEQVCTDALFLHNELRGCSFVYSSSAVEQFLAANQLLSVIRAHEVQDEGFRMFRKAEESGFPTVVCIFSAPNYCDTYGNKASILQINQRILRIKQFDSVPHPYLLPHFMNAFSWSLPFLLDKILDVAQEVFDEEELTEENAEVAMRV